MSNRTVNAEKRAYERVPIALAGKVFFPDIGAEHDCIVTDISLGGATLQCGRSPAGGTKMVLYLDGFDRFAGTVVRADDEEVGMCFALTERERAAAAEKIMLYLSGIAPGASRLRRSERIAVSMPRRFTRASGEVVGFEFCDISLTGALLKTAMRPPLGEIVMIGGTAGRVARHSADGIALEFVQETV